jgi:hypothetical protein
MLENEDEIDGYIGDLTDVSIYILKSKLRIIANTRITDNDQLISISTESILEIKDSFINSIQSTKSLIMCASSQVTLEGTVIQDITQVLGGNFYYMRFVNNSKFIMKNSTLKDITGPLIYSSISKIEIIETSTLENLTNNSPN